MTSMGAPRRLLLAAAPLLLAQPALAGLYPGLSNLNHTCALQEPVLSCTSRAQPDLVDTCCVETFGGLVMLTQLWNTYTGFESEGQRLPKDTWGLHGTFSPPSSFGRLPPQMLYSAEFPTDERASQACGPTSATAPTRSTAT